jgi:hypothetical protein
MIKKRIKVLNLGFLFLFLLVTLFINFFHTEKVTRDDDNCPACHFLNSTFTTSQINFFHLPPPCISGILKTFESFNYKFTFTIDPSSRSPPQV